MFYSILSASIVFAIYGICIKLFFHLLCSCCHWGIICIYSQIWMHLILFVKIFISWHVLLKFISSNNLFLPLHSSLSIYIILLIYLRRVIKFNEFFMLLASFLARELTISIASVFIQFVPLFPSFFYVRFEHFKLFMLFL